MSKEGSIIKFFVGLISGLVTGTVIGLLSSPGSGTETKEKLSFKARELKGRTKDKILDIKELSKDGVERVKNTLRDKAHKLSVKLDEIAKQGSEVLIQDEIH